MSHAVIYVPGLNDTQEMKQGLVLKLWRLYGIHVYYTPINWSKGTYLPKQKRILSLIDRLHKQGKTVSLVASSAGASAILNCFSKRLSTVHRVVYICGKVANIDLISPNRRLDANPAFRESLQLLPDSIAAIPLKQRPKILSARPLFDGVVPLTDTIIQGTNTFTIPITGHIPSIAFGLTIGSPFLAYFIKKP